MTIKIAEFGTRLVNRDELQGDGRHSGKEFRTLFLKPLDTKDWWADPVSYVILDFTGVKTLGPSWANEVFAYFTKFDLTPGQVLEKMRLKNISQVKMETVEIELESGYARAS